MGAIASQITSLTIVYSIVYSGIDQRKHQSSASLAFVRGIHRSPVNPLHKWPVTRKMFPFDDVIMLGVAGHRYTTYPYDPRVYKTISRITGPLCVKSTHRRLMPTQSASDAVFGTHFLTNNPLRRREMIMASRTTSHSSVCSTVCSDWQQRHMNGLRYCPFVRRSTGDRWIPRTNRQSSEKYLHLMTSWCK